MTAQRVWSGRIIRSAARRCVKRCARRRMHWECAIHYRCIHSGFFGTVRLSESVGTTVPPTFIFSPPLTLNEWQFAMNLHNYEWYGLWSRLVETPQLLNQWRWLKRLSCVFRSWNILIVTVCASTFGSCSFELLVSFRGWFSAVTSPKSAIEASMWSACRSVWM